MVNRSLRVVLCRAIVGGFFLAAPFSLSAARPPRPQARVNVSLADSGRTVALSVGQQLVVTLPLWPSRDDNYWYVSRNSGTALKLIQGPDTRFRRNWTPFKPSLEVFYFQRVAPGPADLVLEQSYWSKPMILRVVDR